MNINKRNIKLQHDRERIMFRVYFPLVIVLLCDIYARHFEYSRVQCFVICWTEFEKVRKRLLAISKINVSQ